MAKSSSRPAQRGSQASRARRVRRSVPRGCFHINTSFNNTIITVTARIAAERAAQDSITNDGMREVDVFVSGAGPGREASLRAIAAVGLRVRSIVDSTPIPHNGCRPAKRRRI